MALGSGPPHFAHAAYLSAQFDLTVSTTVRSSRPCIPYAWETAVAGDKASSLNHQDLVQLFWISLRRRRTPPSLRGFSWARPALLHTPAPPPAKPAQRGGLRRLTSIVDGVGKPKRLWKRKDPTGPLSESANCMGAPILDGLISGPGSVYIVYIPSWPKTGGRTCRSWARDRPGQDRCIHKLGALLPWLSTIMAQESMSLLRGVCRPAFCGRSLRASEAPWERGEAFVAAMGARAPATEVRSGTMHGGGRL